MPTPRRAVCARVVPRRVACLGALALAAGVVGCGGAEATRGDAAAVASAPSASVVAEEEERIFSDTVRLLPGQVRAWDLRPGWHRITVATDTRPGEPQRLELAADLRCVPDARGPRETIVCRVRQNTRMLIRHTGVGDRTDAASAVVTILRAPR